MLRRLTFLVACAAIVVGACSSAPPAAPALTDPKEILTKSILSLKDVKSVHFKAEANGQVKIDLTGQGGAGAIDLKGTTAEGDLDIGNKKLKLGFSAPGLFGVAGELIQIVNDSYIKVNLMGEKYQKSTSTPDAAGDVASDPLKVIQEVNDFLNKPGVAPTKLADEKCGDKDCYHVAVNITSDQLGDSLGGLVPSGAPGGTGVLDLWVQKDSLRPAKLGLKVSAGDMGTVDVLVTFSNYDAAVTIEPPPADQVEA